MNKQSILRFEHLPNEILLIIFSYFDGEQLFHAFHNLNLRFNQLIESIDNLYLIITNKNYDDLLSNQFPFQSVSILEYSSSNRLELNQFLSIKKLYLLTTTLQQIQQVETADLPNLEHLTIRLAFPSDIYTSPESIDRINPGRFPRLVSYFLPNLCADKYVDQWTRMLALRKLSIGQLTLSSFTKILSLCPNLEVLQFSMNQFGTRPSSIERHMTLKKLTFKQDLWAEMCQLHVEEYLLYVPNLEQLSIYQAIIDASVRLYTNNDWLASFIKTHLKCLQTFHYYLEFVYFQMFSEYDLETILEQIRDNFKRIHGHQQYQSQLIVLS